MVKVFNKPDIEEEFIWWRASENKATALMYLLVKCEKLPN